MALTLDQIESFVEAANRGSFSAAARALGKSQSTISTALANLEIELDTPLFDRSTKKPTLTQAGRALLSEAHDLYERALTLQSHATSLAAGNPSAITLAVDVPYRFITPALHDFAAAHPHVDLVLRHPTEGDVPHLILNGDADLGMSLALPAYEEGLEFRRLGNLILTHAAHRDHPLGRQRRVTFADLDAYRRLAHPMHARFLPTSEYIQPVQTWLADNYTAVIDLLLSRVGWATLPRQLILDELETGTLVELQLQAYPHTEYLVGTDLLWLRNGARAPAIEWLRDRLERLEVSEGDPYGRHRSGTG